MEILKKFLSNLFKKNEKKIDAVDLKIGPEIKWVSKDVFMKSYDKTYCQKSMVSYDEVHDFDR